MSATGTVLGVTTGGIAGSHKPVEDFALRVAPATANQFNLVRMRLIPVACWRVDDIRFDFDSSVVLPGVRDEMPLLAQLIAKHSVPDPLTQVVHPPPISLFGHADPVGNDDYNKSLSGRRAAAIYGLVTRRDEVWEDLYSNTGIFAKPVVGDKWGTRSIQLMLNEVAGPVAVDGQNGSATRSAISDFQTQNGLPADGNAGPATRKQLFLAYMDKICVDDTGTPFTVDKVDGFLGRNQDDGGKGDFQGCSEFNPSLVFSGPENARFEKAQDKSDRNAANAPNRRVMALLFRANSVVLPEKWPCPRAKEGVAGCKKRFFSDGEDRRSRRLPDRDRTSKEDKDTFACRFYDRLSSKSPCEKILITFSFRLYDLERKFIALAPFELTVGGGTPIKGLSDPNGFAIVPDVEVPNQVVIKWGFPPEPGQLPELVFEGQMFLDPDDKDQDTEATQKLQNLGYSQDNPLDENVAAFQRDYGRLATPTLLETGNLDDATMALLRDVWASSEDDLQNDQPERKSN